MPKPRYLSVEEVLRLHDILIEETSGSHGVRDLKTIDALTASAQQKVFGRELYETAYDKAGAYMHGIIMNHPFVDGNKRTGMATGIIFLEDNGYVFEAKEGEIEYFAVRIVKEKLEIPDIATWLARHCKKR